MAQKHLQKLFHHTNILTKRLLEEISNQRGYKRFKHSDIKDKF